jgi:glutaredoxin-related protein
MKRLDESKKHPKVIAKMNAFHADVVDEVIQAVESNKVVVVGMAQNPHVKKAKSFLKASGIDFKYLEYGSYASMWHARLAIKIWAGWPTFPMVFIDQTLVGGASDLIKLKESGELNLS